VQKSLMPKGVDHAPRSQRFTRQHQCKNL